MAIKRFIPINIRLPKTLIDESDKFAELEGSTRSELVRNALRAYIERRKKLQAAYSIIEQRGKQAGIDSDEDINKALSKVREKRK